MQGEIYDLGCYNMEKDILDEFKEIMEKDVSITLDFEIFQDLNRYKLISDKEYKDFLESNQKRYGLKGESYGM